MLTANLAEHGRPSVPLGHPAINPQVFLGRAAVSKFSHEPQRDRLCVLVAAGLGFKKCYSIKRWQRRSVGVEQDVEAPVSKSFSTEDALPPRVDFNWEKQWYPILPEDMLRTSGPEPIRLLGRDLVLWKDSAGKWRCTDGICPHRLAPLAHGRVTSEGQLMCRFHGWTFNGDGSCVKVPMAEGDATAEAKLVGAACSKLRTYPTRSVKGLIFVWPHSESWDEASKKEPFVAEELAESPNWSVFDAPASWRVWLEQSWDPSHAPFLHQYALPNFAPELAYAMEPFEVEDLGDDGLSARHGGYMQSNKGMKAYRRFGPPCANSTSYVYPDGRTIGFNFYFVPTEPGKVRQITTSYFVPAPTDKGDDNGLSGNMMQMSKVVLKGRTVGGIDKERVSFASAVKSRIKKRWPKLDQIERGLKSWKLMQGLIGDQDNTILSFQDSVGLRAVQSGRFREPRSSQKFGGPPTEYLLETNADELVSRFDSWVAARGGGPFGFGREENQTGFSGVFDRWEAHTRFSKDAQAALAFLSGTADFLESRVVPACAVVAALCMTCGLTRISGLPTLAAAAGIFAKSRLRKHAQGFLSGLPPGPGLPLRKLWE
ncbi:PAO [Symbiodinium pilosum]|uniref:PAO protein n=1 Tax=Symbiodinium pilosum TaxID=2952 RepID=A0A812T6X1_SYMPI|nr:PAO [Symbiodinium pilosum]